MELQATDPVWIEDVRVMPDVKRGVARLRVRVRNISNQSSDAVLTAVAARPGAAELRSEMQKAVPDLPDNIIEWNVPLGTAPMLWDDRQPNLYTLEVSLRTAGPAPFNSSFRTTFGVRAFTREGMMFAINGRKLVLRGNVDNSTFPIRGYPHMTVSEWRGRLQTYRTYGMNHARFHSWCPPEAAFRAADQLGLILQIENPLWVRDGRVSSDSQRVAFIREEAERIVTEYGNHPSFCLMSMGNELGKGLDPFLAELVNHLRSRDDRRFYTSTSSPNDSRRPDDYFVTRGLRGEPRFAKYPPNTSFDFREFIAKLDRPTLAHELGQWTVFPDLDELGKYTGVQEARYLTAYREMLDANGLTAQARDFRRASGALLATLIKEEVESMLRTTDLAGFQYLGLADWPGYGPAHVGILDAFDDPKGVLSPEQFRRFNGDTIPLLRLSKRTWHNSETAEAAAAFAHYGPTELRGIPEWRLTAGTCVLAQGKLAELAALPGQVSAAGLIHLPLKDLAAGRYTIELQLGALTNSWDIWVYPDRLDTPATPHLLETKGWNDAARAALQGGRDVLLLLGDSANTVQTSFTTSFWSSAWRTDRKGTETMGVLCNPAHPALRGFPTAFHSDWQWWELMSNGRALILNGAPRELAPIVQVIDDMERNHKLGAVVEARVAKGRLLLTTFDLYTSLDERIVARQMRHSLQTYMASGQFQPRTVLTIELLDRLLRPGARPECASCAM